MYIIALAIVVMMSCCTYSDPRMRTCAENCDKKLPVGSQRWADCVTSCHAETDPAPEMVASCR